MVTPVRPAVFTLCEWQKEAGKMTLREAVEWYKHVARADIGTPTGLEVEYLNKRWGALITEIAAREGVPAGLLSYMLNEIATQELKLMEVAKEETEVALSYGQPTQKEGD